ncbi:class I glutamine amidotransferase-like protein [Xylariaceae sp. FL0255]|nr:class I glutamine amidotransferase-like protein [Xylariaceae sp. FL0255]
MAVPDVIATVRVAMLNVDTPVPNVFAKLGTYGAIFDRDLKEAAKRIALNVTIESQDFNVLLGEYLSPEAISSFDMFLVTGSAASAYDDAEWIHRLDAFLRNVWQRQPTAKLFGSCFGHQVMCKSLLDLVVEKDPNGWEIGVHPLELTDEFISAFRWGSSTFSDVPNGMQTPPHDGPVDLSNMGKAAKTMRLQLVHADHVRLPEGGLPDGWVVVGKTQSCANQGVYLPGRAFTFQGHFEFDKFVNSETLKVFGAMWEPKILEAALGQIDNDDDAERAAEMVLRFALEEEPGLPSGLPGGLLTPPIMTS